MFDFIFDTLFALNDDINTGALFFGDYHSIIHEEKTKTEKTKLHFKIPENLEERNSLQKKLTEILEQ